MRNNWTTPSSPTLRYEIATWALVVSPWAVWLVSFPVCNKWGVPLCSWKVPTPVILNFPFSDLELLLFCINGLNVLFQYINNAYMCKWIFIWGEKAKKEVQEKTKVWSFEINSRNTWNSSVNLRKTPPVGLLNVLCFFCNVFLALFIVFSGIISFSQLLYICTCFWYVKSFLLRHEPLAHPIGVRCFLQWPSSDVHLDMFIFPFSVGLWIYASELVMMFAHYSSSLKVIFLKEKKKPIQR